MHRVTFLVILVLAWLESVNAVPSSSRSIGRSTRFIVRPTVIWNCDQYPHLPARFTRSEISLLDKFTYVVGGEGVVERPMQRIESGLMNITHCRDKANPDTCEHFQTWKFKGVGTLCNMFEAKNALWSSLISGFEPPLRCPRPEGPWTLTNSTLDLKYVQAIAFPMDGYWKANLIGFDENTQPWSCIHFEGEFLRLRV